MKNMKRIISVFLTLLMLVLAVPFGALQAGAVNIPTDAVKFNGHYYKAFDEAMSWTEAKAYCESLGGHLATVTSAEENDFVFAVIENKTKNLYWIGGSDAEQEGVWQWVTGETWNYTNWSLGNGAETPKKPDNCTEGEDYLMAYRVRLAGNPAGTWNDLPNDGDDDGVIAEGFYLLSNYGFVCEWDNIYNLGEETYRFENYGDDDSAGGHCFGMSMTSSAYFKEIMNIDILGGASENLYTYNDGETVREPICYYQARQGSKAKTAVVAGGFYYVRGFWNKIAGKEYDIESDWDEVVNYVRGHEFDDRGTLQLAIRKKGKGGHAINFLRYEEVNGESRIYAYDNNFPTSEVYFYMNALGDVYEHPNQTFSGPLDCIALRDVSTYFDSVEDFDTTHTVYAADGAIAIDTATAYPMDGDIEMGEHVMFELPDDLTQVKIVPLKEHASFTYMDKTYTFDNIDEDTYAVLTLATDEAGVGAFAIENAPEIKPDDPTGPSDPTDPTTPTEPTTPNEPTQPDSGNNSAPKLNFFQRIIQWFRNLFARLFGKR